MNWIQMVLFVLYVTAMLMSGLAWHGLIVPKEKTINRFVHLGEALLLGAMIIVGEMLILSLIGNMYKAIYLWGAMALNILCIFLPHVRRGWCQIFARPVRWNTSLVIFILILLIFAFRNCYFLIDSDSSSTYLFTQKLWLEHGTSIFASTAVDMRIFVPQFNSVPYALSLCIFPMETFFPQMVVAFWTVIVLFLVFGYVSARWSRAYALAAAMLVLFDDHMFYSGANISVVINSALIAFLFAGTYNFWEARRQNDPLRWVMALIFLSQVFSNKYQLLLSLILLVLLGMLIQPDLGFCWQRLWKKPSYWLSLLAAVFIFALWPLKNYLATGDPFFPILADRFHVLNWTTDKAQAFNKIFVAPLSFGMVVKYLNYLLSWPWFAVGRLFAFFITVWPAIWMLSYIRKKDDPGVFAELGYWFTVSMFIMVGTCMVSFCDPRPYRYGIAVMAVAAVLMLDYIFARCFGWSRRWVTAAIIIVGLQGWPVITHQGVLKKPDFSTNLMILQDKLHMKDFINYMFKENAIIFDETQAYHDLMPLTAWNTDANVGSIFLLPTRPEVNVWYTNVVKWDSYRSPDLVAQDLRNAGIYFLLSVRDGHLYFENALDYGKRVAAADRIPKTIYYDYGFPKELIQINN